MKQNGSFFATTLALASLIGCSWYAAQHNEKTSECFSNYISFEGVLVNVTSTEYPFSGMVNNSLCTALNTLEHWTIADTAVDSELQLYNFCAAEEQYWCCINTSVCSLITLSTQCYSRCFSWPSLTQYKVVNYSVGQEISAYNHRETQDSFTTQPSPDCTRPSRSLWYCLAIVGIIGCSFAILALQVCLMQPKSQDSSIGPSCNYVASRD